MWAVLALPLALAWQSAERVWQLAAKASPLAEPGSMPVELPLRLMEPGLELAELVLLSLEPGSLSVELVSPSAEPELESAVGRTRQARKQKTSGIKFERSSASPLRMESLRDGRADRAAGKQNSSRSIASLFSVRYSSTQNKTSQSK